MRRPDRAGEVGEPPAEGGREAVDHPGRTSARASTATAPRSPTSKGFASNEVSRPRRSWAIRAIASTAVAAARRSCVLRVEPAVRCLVERRRREPVRGQRTRHEDRSPLLGEGSARSHRDHRPEPLVDDGAHEHLGAPHHLLHEHLRRACPARLAASSTSAAATSTSVALRSPSRTPPSFALCGISGAWAFTTTGNPIERANAAACSGLGDAPLLRARDPVQAQDPGTGLLVDRALVPAQHAQRLRPVRVRRQVVGGRPRLRALELDERPDRPRRGVVALQERQCMLPRERLRRRLVGERAHRHAGEHHPGRRAAAPRPSSGPGRPTASPPRAAGGTRRRR